MGLRIRKGKRSTPVTDCRTKARKSRGNSGLIGGALSEGKPEFDILGAPQENFCLAHTVLGPGANNRFHIDEVRGFGRVIGPVAVSTKELAVHRIENEATESPRVSFGDVGRKARHFERIGRFSNIK